MPARASAAKLSLGHIRASAFSSNFLAAGHRFGHFSINHAMFTKFLASAPIMIRADTRVILSSLSESTAPVTTESFTADGCTFSRNTTPDVGAAIHVEAIGTITGDVKNCFFTSNTASFGGAIFFSAADGALTLANCQLEHNEADAGAHMLISCATLTATNVDLSFGSGGTCVELSQIKTEAKFTSCNFFRNLGTFCTVATTLTTTLESCCFMNYTDDGRTLSSDKLFSGTGQVTLTKTFLNGEEKKQETVAADAVTFTPVQEPTGDGSVCRLVPTPSATMNVTFSTAAIFIVVSCAFFVLVSIIGILIVVCCNSKRNDEELLEEKESSSSGKGKGK